MISYAGNKNPEYITCMQKESSVAIANGYAKIEGKPVMVCAYGTVGLQHAAMAICAKPLPNQRTAICREHTLRNRC